VGFLHQKETQFDTIISKKEALIKTLEEAKKSLISEVVTGKIKVVKTSTGYELVERKKEEMKDSGVEWLGDVPIEWETKAIRYLFQLRNERNAKDMKDVQLLSLFTALGVKKQGEVLARGNKVRTVEDYKEVYPDDIVVNIILAWMGAIGVSQDRGVISPAYDIYKPINPLINSKFYHYVFRTGRFSGECYKKGRGIMDMRWRTYSNEFKSIIVPVVSTDEQKLLTNFLDSRITDIENLINKTKQQIKNIKAAKQSLISEAVTGKIEILD
jgi:type I restriction enzyme S subunit